MKRLVLIAVATAALAACAGLPRPQSEDNSLVIGYLLLDFPDGFFAERARTVTDGVKVTFVNKTRQAEFSVYTSHGYYYFLSNGTDEYVMKTYKYETRFSSGGTGSVGGGEIMSEISTQPGKVVYLGHTAVSYKTPKLTKRLGGDAQTFWKYDIGTDSEWNAERLTDFLRDDDPDCPWLDCEVVRP